MSALRAARGAVIFGLQLFIIGFAIGYGLGWLLSKAGIGP